MQAVDKDVQDTPSSYSSLLSNDRPALDHGRVVVQNECNTMAAASYATGQCEVCHRIINTRKCMSLFIRSEYRRVTA
jgi:hypothetical protein